MGILPKKEKKEIPSEFVHVFEVYKDIRFSLTHDNKLLPRETISHQSINEYMKAMQSDLSPTEISVIMSIDAIYERATKA